MPRSLVRAKKEQLPLSDGTARGGAELILFQIRFRLPGGTPEERVGVEHVVAHELPGVAVKIVLTTLGDQGRIGHLRAVHGVVLRGLNLQLRDGVGIGNRAGSIGAVQGIRAGRGVAVHIDVSGAAAQRSRIVHIGGGSRGHGEHLREVAGGQRDRRNGPGVHHRAGGRRGDAHAALAVHRLSRLSKLQNGVQHRDLRDAHHQ